MNRLLLLLLLVVAMAAAAAAEEVVVTIDKGDLKGARLDHDYGQYYYAFKGIPYAKPPVKELRFKVGFNPSVPRVQKNKNPPIRYRLLLALPISAEAGVRK